MRRQFASILMVLLLLCVSVPVLLIPLMSPGIVLAANSADIDSSTSDGHLLYTDVSYSTCRTAGTAEFKGDDLSTVVVESRWTGAEYQIYRGYLYFNTAFLDATDLITAVSLGVFITDISDGDGDDVIRIQIDPDHVYPSDPLVTSDYDYSQYEGNLGAKTIASFVDDDWNTMTVYEAEWDHINRDGYTKLCLRSYGYDILDFAPSGDNHIWFESASETHKPYLHIEWVDLPTVAVSAATDILQNTATLNGNITGLGGENSDNRGFVWGDNSLGDPGNVAPTAAGYDSNWSEAGSFGTGAFSHGVTSLISYTTYYFRACAHNSAGWSYSAETSFATLPDPPSITTSDATSITNISATLPGNITDTGKQDPTVTVYWGDNDGGTTPGSWDYNSVPTSPGQPQGVAAFYKDITGLSPGETYYFRAAATNSGGTTWAAATRNFQTTDVYPSVTTNSASSVDNQSATLNGNITSTGGDPTCDYRGFCWDNVTHGDPGDVAPVSCGYDGPPGSGYYTYSGSYGTGNFTHALTGLSPGTAYYYRAYAHNSSGWQYGAEVSFTSHSLPSVTTDAGSSVLETSFILNGTIVSVGGDPGDCDYYGWCWDTQSRANPGNVALSTVAYTWWYGYGPGSYAADSYDDGPWAGAIPGTTYYVRFCAANTYGWIYGDEVTVTTLPEPPTNLNVYEVTYTSFGLTWTPGLHAEETMIRYNYSENATEDYPTDVNDGTEAYKGAETSTELTMLTPGGSYWVRAWSWVEGSDVWSDDYAQTSITLPIAAPEALRAKAIDAHTINLWWLVPEDMVAVSTVTTIINAAIGDYPTDPPDSGDIEVYTALTGDAGVKNYIWTDANAGTPYFFAIWFYNSATSSYTTPEYAATTTPAGFDTDTSDNKTSYFDDPSASQMGDNPFDPAVAHGADIWGFEHGMMWAFLVMVVAIIVGVGFAIATKSMLVTMVAMGAVMGVAAYAQICPWWLPLPFGALGIPLTYIGSRQTT